MRNKLSRTLFDAAEDGGFTYGQLATARSNDPQTAHQAAQHVRRKKNALEPIILRAYAEHGPMSDDELCRHVPAWPPSVKTARSRLSRRFGLLVDSGDRVPSDRGREQIVWALDRKETSP